MQFVNIIFIEDSESKHGADWIRHLIPWHKFHRISKKDAETADLYTNCVVVSHTSAGFAYLKRLTESAINHAFVLLSDETLSEPMDYLDSPYCQFVARNYVHPHVLSNPKVLHFPLGWVDGFYQFAHEAQRIKASKRKNVWSFAGSLKADRQIAIGEMSKLMPFQLNVFEFFHDPNHLTPDGYAKTLSNSQFVIAPMGGCNIDSFRIYEALEAGCIPVALDQHQAFKIHPNYWHAIFRQEAPMPFVVASTWGEAAQKVKAIVDEGRVNEVQSDCRAFWARWKEHFRHYFTENIEALLQM
jgi:hypothetical protein